MLALPQPGETIAGKYEVVRVLGKGGMGIVLEAVHRKLAQRFAIKLLLPDALERPDALARFEREARASARLKSPYVVRVLDVDNDVERGGLPFIVMEYLEGNDLAAELRRRGGPLPIAESVDWLLQACLAMHEAHARGIVHRDLKPSNLFLCAEAGIPIIKVMDFGISKLVASPGEGDLTTTETTLGTPNYMAPEQLVSAKTIDHRVDIWALGVVLYRFLTGSLPFSGDSTTALAVAIATQSPVPVTDHNRELPAPLAAAIMSTLVRDPDRRPQDALAFARLLEPFGSGRVSLATPLVGMPTPSDPMLLLAAPAGDEVEVELTGIEPTKTGSAWAQSPVKRAKGRGVLPFLAGLLILGLVSAGVVAIARGRQVVTPVSELPPSTASVAVTEPGGPSASPPVNTTVSPRASASATSSASAATSATVKVRVPPRPSTMTSPTAPTTATVDPLHL